ncbi:MAG: hypothetical protein RIR26_2476, partial [Pseudomonadota bacterium]
FDNTAHARRYGVFAQTAAQVSWLRWEAHTELLHSQLVRGQPGQKIIPFIPLWQGRLKAGTSLKDCGVPEVFHPWSTAVEWDQSGSYGLDPEGLGWLTPPSLLAFSAEALFPSGAEEWRLGFRVDNLLDERNSLLRIAGAQKRSVPWVSSPVLPIAGRTFELNLRLLTP